MPWIKGLNFRATSGFVTDGGDETYVLDPNVEGKYPITRNGVTFGYTDAIISPAQVRDRNSGIDRRLAGVHFWDISGAGSYPGLFRVDLPAAGQYKIGLAAGDASSSRATGFAEVRDDTTVLVTIDHASGFTSGANFRDATDVELSAANWPGSNTLATVTFATTILRLAIGKYNPGSLDGWIAHLYIEQVDTATLMGAILL